MVIPYTEPVIGSANWGPTLNTALADIAGGAQPADAELSQIAALADPNADRILFWDDSAGAYTFLAPSGPLVISGTSLDAPTMATKAKLKIADLVSAMTKVPRTNIPDLHPSPPTLSYNTSARTVTGKQVAVQSSMITKRGPVGAYDPSWPRLFATNGVTALDFEIDDISCEFTWISASVNGDRIWVWVDGMPCTAIPTATPGGITTSAGLSCYGKILFGARGRHRITVYAASINGWQALGINATGMVAPAPQLPRIALIGDSFIDGSAGSAPLQCLHVAVGISLDVDAIGQGIGGTGWNTGSELFGASARRTRVAVNSPDVLVFVGGINDSATGLQTAMTTALNSYVTDFPGVPIIVFGPQPSSSSTVTNGRLAVEAAMRAACASVPQVIAFHGMIGGNSSTAPGAYNAGTTYNQGDLVTYLNSIWKYIHVTSGSGSAPGAGGRWELMTWEYSGTGQVGSLAGDGSRDVYLYSDGTHPMPEGSAALGYRIAKAIREDLLAYAAA